MSDRLPCICTETDVGAGALLVTARAVPCSSIHLRTRLHPRATILYPRPRWQDGLDPTLLDLLKLITCYSDYEEITLD
jgi:hypothetical protein